MLIPLFILVLLFYINANKFNNCEISVQFLLSLDLDDNLYISVIVVSPNSKRVPSLLNAWGYEFISKRKNMFKIFSPFNDDSNSTYWKFVNISDKNIAYYKLAFYCNFESAHDFYENTDLKWYLRTTYDCFIHLQNLYGFIQKLNDQYDPTQDIVFKGDYTGSFIHGGPGWIMSRAAVHEYLKMEDEMTIEYKKYFYGDDVNILMFTEKFNLTFDHIYAPEFVGWPVKDSSYNSLIESNFTFSNISKACNKDLQPTKVNSIVIWHNGRNIDYVNAIGKRIINEAPGFLGLHFIVNEGGEFCRLNAVRKTKTKI